MRHHRFRHSHNHKNRPIAEPSFWSQFFLLLCFLLFGIPLALVTIYGTIDTLTFLPQTRVTTGEIISLRKGFPEIAFKTLDGQEVSFKSGSSNSHDRIGGKVKVRYKTQAPRIVKSLFALKTKEKTTPPPPAL